MRKLFMFIAALTLSAGLWAETRTVSYDYPVYNTPDDPKRGIASWQTGEVEATVLENITETTWWGTGSDQGVSVLYSITRNLDKTLTFHVDAWGDVTSIATPQINIAGNYNNVDGDGNYTTTATYETDEVVNLFFHIPFTGAAARIDVAYTVGSKNIKPSIEVTGVSIVPSQAAVAVGGTTSLTAIIKPAFATNTNISWSVIAGSENASVDANGVVTGRAAGAATIQVTTESGSKTANCDVNVVAQMLLEPDAAPAAPTVPANQVKAVYSSTYSADCGFGDWGGGTAYTQDTYGKKYVNAAGGYFGMVDFALNCSQMEYLHLDVWAFADLTFRVVPIHGGAEKGVTVNIEGQKWNSIDLSLSEGAYAEVTDWSNVYQIKIDQAADETFWLNNVYFYTTQEKTTCALSASVKNNEGGTASVSIAEVAKGGTATFTAVAACGYSFVGWWNNTTKVSENATYTPTDIQEDLTLVAEFAFVGPSEAATVPSYDMMIPIYTNGTPAEGVSMTTSLGQRTIQNSISVAGHTMFKYGNIDYQGIAFENNLRDVSAMKYVHLDIWSTKTGIVKFFLIWPGQDNETSVTVDLIGCQWNSINIPLNEFIGADLTQIHQFKFDAQPTIGEGAIDGATILVQDIFFYAPNEITLTASDFTVTKDGDWTYDQTEKRVKVEISEEYIMPESSNIEIYYNNDPMVKPINPGTYQVYIDIEETDIYAAVTGITSDAWKFDIIDREGAIQAIKDKKEEAVQAINSEAGDFETVPTEKVVEGAKVNLEDVTITATNTINEATDQSTITTTKDNAISEIDKIEASAKTDIQTAIAKFKKSEQNEIDNVATATKSEIDAFPVSEKVKDDAKSKIDQAVAEAEETIDNANSKEQIYNAKQDACSKFSKQLENVEASYAQLQDDKVVAIQKIEEVAADAEAAIDEAAGEYASLQAIGEIISSKKEEIASGKSEASYFIGAATDMEEISQQKEEAIQHIEDIKSKAVEEIQAAIASLQQNAINDIQAAADAAKEEIDGLGVDESVKSEAKAQINNIANTAEQTINAAISKDAIDNAKTEAIADINNVIQTTKDMWIPVRENMTVGNYGTLCWNYNLTAIEGAELYSVAGLENNRIILQEVLANETQAGAGYVIRATAKGLWVKNGDQYTDTPLPAADCNGLQGTFADIVDGAAGAPENKLEGNYIIYQNEWRKCGVYTGLLSNRAYLVKDEVPNVIITQAPGRKYVSMALPYVTQTELNNVIADSDAITDIDKYFYKGQVIIRKGDKSFNIQGIEILPIE